MALDRLTVYGDRVRDARVIQRIKAQDVATLAEIPPDRYSRMERTPQSSPNSEVLQRVADSLNFPVAYFTTPSTTVVQRGSLLFRARKAMTRGEEDELVAWARLIGDLLDAAEQYAHFPEPMAPRVSSSASDAAAATRQAMNLSDDEPVPHLVRSMERLGIFIAALDFDAELHARHHDAFSTWTGDHLERPLVVLRLGTSWERARMSLAHELGHLVMHRTVRSENVEGEAYDFAAQLLLPKALLEREWPTSPTLTSLLPLKRKWGLSIAALIEHAFRSGLIERDRRTGFYRQLSNRRHAGTGERWRTLEPGHEDREVERPKLLGRAAEVAFQDQQIDGRSELWGHWPSRFVRQVLAGQDTAWCREACIRTSGGGITPMRGADVFVLPDQRESSRSDPFDR